MADGTEPIADDEIFYRRIPAAASPAWYDPTTGRLSDQAFAPHKTEDVTGLSISRAKYKTMEEAARGRPGKSYYVALLPAGAIRQAGMRIEPRPQTQAGYDAGHAELSDLNSANRKETITLERQRVLAELCIRVEGPFATPNP